jgi:cysteine desulfuration protein SufE
VNDLFSSCLAKQQQVKELFSKASSPEEVYQIIIDLGKKQKALPEEEKTEKTLVKGCQSKTFLKSHLHDGKCIFEIESDALISAGLGQLLTLVYSGEPPEVVIKCSPKYLEELGIIKSLSPSRSQGLSSMFNRMKLEAIKML